VENSTHMHVYVRVTGIEDSVCRSRRDL